MFFFTSIIYSVFANAVKIAIIISVYNTGQTLTFHQRQQQYAEWEIILDASNVKMNLTAQ